jgi:hypothetical protein
MSIPSFGITIDEKTYPLALALLPEGFARIPMDEVLGCILTLDVKRFSILQNQQCSLAIDPAWIKVEDLEEFYPNTDLDESSVGIRVLT